MRWLVALLLLPAATPAATARYLLAYADCAGTCRTALAQSQDGVRWSSVAVAAGAGDTAVPVRRGSELYVFGALTASGSGLAGTVRRFRLDGAAPTELPSLSNSLLLSDPQEVLEASRGSFGMSALVDRTGALTLVYAIRLEPSTNACPVAGQACVKVRSATEAAGSDGTSFTGDAGNRLVASFPPADAVGPPAVLAGEKGYVLLVAAPGGCLRAATATDVHGRFSPLGPCLAQGVDSPSGFWNARLGEYWLYGESGGRLVRAVARKLAPPLRFRPLPAPAAVASPRFASPDK